MVPLRFRSPGYGRGVAHLRAALDLLRCSHHYVHSRPGNHLVLYHAAVQPDFPAGDDPVGRNSGIACVETETRLRLVWIRKNRRMPVPRPFRNGAERVGTTESHTL